MDIELEEVGGSDGFVVVVSEGVVEMVNDAPGTSAVCADECVFV